MPDKTGYEHGGFKPATASKKAPPRRLDDKEAPPKPDEHPTRDTRETPAPNPDGNPAENDRTPPFQATCPTSSPWAALAELRSDMRVDLLSRPNLR
jgi:hypothetical protein